MARPKRVETELRIHTLPRPPSFLGLATGETLAHLNCLLHRGRISRELDDNGIYWYQQVPETAEFD